MAVLQYEWIIIDVEIEQGAIHVAHQAADML